MPDHSAPDVEIRPARLDDLEAIETFIEPFVNARFLLPRTADELAGLLTTGFVAELDGEVVGFATLEMYSRKLGEIRSLCVARRLQGCGIGKRLTQACIDLARQHRIFEVMVVTSSEEFFRACGFDFTLPGEKKALFLQTREEP